MVSESTDGLIESEAEGGEAAVPLSAGENGVNSVGTTRRLKILRIVAGKRTELKASLGDKLQPGDTVVVASRWF